MSRPWPSSFGGWLVVRRAVAYSFDMVLVAAYALVLFAVVRGLRLFEGAGSGPEGQVIGLITLTLPVAAAFALWESSRQRATPGKRLLGLVVVAAPGGRLARPAAMARNLLKLLPWEVSHWAIWRIEGWPTSPGEPTAGALWGLGLAWALVVLYVVSLVASPARGTVYDRLAGARVILRRSEALSSRLP